MSTESIKEALEAYRKTRSPLDERYVLIMKALDEVVAIEQMAAVLITCDITAPADMTVNGFTPAMRTLGRLAKGEKVAPESGQA